MHSGIDISQVDCLFDHHTHALLILREMNNLLLT